MWRKGVPCALLVGICVCVCVSAHSVVSDSVRPPGLWPARLLCPWDSPGKNTGGGCHFLLQGIFLTQGSNLCLLCPPHWQVGSLPAIWEAPVYRYSYYEKQYKDSSKKLKIKLSYDPAIPLLGIYSRKTKTLTWKDICTHMFI